MVETEVIGGRARTVRGRDTDKCPVCGAPKALTGQGRFYPLAVRGPKRDYVFYICEECVALFNSAQWSKTRQALRKLRRHAWGR